MAAFLTFLATALATAAMLSKVFDYLLTESAKQQLKAFIESAWIVHSDRHPSSISRAPLQTAIRLLDFLFGDRIISTTAIRRSCLLSVLVLILSLALTGLQTGDPFAIRLMPWISYKRQLDAAASTPETLNTIGPIPENYAEQYRLEQKEIERYKYLARFNKPAYAALYTILLLLFTFSLTTAAWFSLISLFRYSIRVLLPLDSLFLSTCVLWTTLCFAAALLVLSTGTVCLAGFPILLVSFTKILSLSSVFGALAFIVIAAISWFASPAAQTIAIVTVLPAIVFVLALLMTLALLPFRHAIHKVLGYIMLRATEHTQSPLAFAVGLLGSLSGLVFVIRRVVF